MGEGRGAQRLRVCVFQQGGASAEGGSLRSAGHPQDYLFAYRDGIAGVAAEEVLASARRHLHPREQAVVVGDAASLELQGAGLRTERLGLKGWRGASAPFATAYFYLFSMAFSPREASSFPLGNFALQQLSIGGTRAAFCRESRSK